MKLRACEPSLMVVFGGTGDLSRRKLLPALARLVAGGHVSSRFRVLALGRRDYDDRSFAQEAARALEAAGVADEVAKPLCDGRLHYQRLGLEEADDYTLLRERIEAIEAEHELAQNRTFYLALPPQAFTAVIGGLGQSGLSRSDGWTRLVVEKPFGRDLDSARTLNQAVHRWFEEEQIYRIDHYLGKDPVQNLLVFRFANAMLEALWNRHHVEAVHIVASESLGVGTRAGYYDRSGAIRDMLQNHLTQLLTLVAMEPPVAFDAASIRAEKLKVLKAIAPLTKENIVRGQYVAGEVDGEAVPGYADAEGIEPGSSTESFAAVRLGVDNWRWSGVPFYLVSGKRLPSRCTDISIVFRGAPVGLFKTADGSKDTPDVLHIRLQPNEGFTLKLDVKMPGTPFRLQRIPLSFRYGERFEPLPEAYQTLLHDVLSGDQTLFVHGDEVEASWGVYGPLLNDPTAPEPYPAGSWGPERAAAMVGPIAEDGE